MHARRLTAIATSAIALATTGILAWGCGGGGGGGSKPLTGPGSMMGRVNSTDGTPIGSATVTFNGQTVTANDQGWFFFTDVTAADHLRVMITASNYAPVQRYVDVKAGRNTFLDVHMFASAPPVAIDSTVGGAVTNGAAQLNLPAGAFRTAAGGAFSGNANVSLTLIDPSDVNGLQAVPGGFEGIPATSFAGSPVPFESFGMLNVAATDDSGNPLTLSSAANTVFSLPSQSTGATPPATVPLWRFDETQGTWLEVGSASYSDTAGGYTAPVSSGGYWNCDQPYATACVTGKIVTPDGDPAIGGIEVTSQGVSYVGSNTTYTDEGGTFKVLLKASTSTAPMTAQIYAQGGGLYTDTPLAVDPTPMTLASSGTCTDVGTIQLAYPLASVVLTWGATPSDLDSHFTGPDGMGGRFHMYYSDKNPAGGVASLDTDDTSSYGPEVTALLKAVPGTYVYAIHNYSGESNGPIASSGAQIRAFFPGEMRTFDVADATGTTTDGTAVWRVFKFTIGSDGTISHLQPIMKIVPESDTAYDP